MGYFINFLTKIIPDVFYIRNSGHTMMRYGFIIFFMGLSLLSFSQEAAKPLSKQEIKAQKNAEKLVYEGNTLLQKDKFTKAEKEYRKAISEQSDNVAGLYNLGNSYYKNGLYDEALLRQKEALKNAKTKKEKHMAYHNIGNTLMKNKKCKEAVTAYKNALRNDPTDDETRYNLVLAQDCAKKQEKNQNKNDKNKDKKDQNKDKKDQNKDKNDKNKNDKNKDKKDQDKDQKNKDKKDQGKDKKDDQGKPKNDKKDQNKGDQKDQKNQQPPKPRPGQLSPQQVKNLLEAMNNQEQKVQKKMNAKKEKGVAVKTDKDW